MPAHRKKFITVDPEDSSGLMRVIENRHIEDIRKANNHLQAVVCEIWLMVNGVAV